MLKLSVVIPTFKRHEKLFRALESLQEQSNTDFELLVVNNNIEDGLKDKILDYNKSARIKVNYVNYPKKGLFGARNAGVHYSSGDVILYIDDDETFVSDLVEQYYNLFSNNSEIMVAGGACVLRFEEMPPVWVLDYLKDKRIDNIWGHYTPHDDIVIAEAVNVWGGNMAVRREVFTWTGWHPDVVNGKLLGAGDSGLVMDVANKEGALMAFLPKAIIYHHIPKQRVNFKHVRWSASYIMNTRMYYRYRDIEPTLSNISKDLIATIFEYYKLWIKDLFYARYVKNSKSLNIQYLASMGFWKLRYLYWLLFRKDVKAFIKQKKYVTLDEKL